MPFNEVGDQFLASFDLKFGESHSTIASTALRMSGVANRTNGIIITQAKIHDLNQWLTKSPLWISGALAIAEAMAVVNQTELIQTGNDCSILE